jgi:hypothetical protein
MVAVAGCGGSDDPKPATTTAATTPRSTAKPANAEPNGKLSRPEYRSLRAAYGLLAPLDDSKDYGKVLRAGRRACVRVTTQTELLATVHADCVQTMRFYSKAVAMVRRQAECTRAAQAGDTSCFADVFRSLGRSARVAGVRSAATNAALRKRAIRGDCAKAIGTDERELAAARDVHRAGIRAAHALEAKNKSSFENAVSRLTAALDRMDAADTSARDAHRRLKACVQ